VGESILFPEVDIGRDCRIRCAIIDHGCHLTDGMFIGDDAVEDA